MSLDILVVDDERDIRELVAGVLEDEGYSTRRGGAERRGAGGDRGAPTSLVLLDVWLHGSRLDGLEILDEIKRRDPSIPVLVISGHGNLDTAVAAIRRGASRLHRKAARGRAPAVPRRARHRDRAAQARSRLAARLDRPRGGSDRPVGRDQHGARHVERVASTGSRVLITGSAGTGKEVAARLLHGWSQRAAAPFVIVSAARMQPERVEEELFGVEEGGDLVRTGLLEQAHGGTLFLDEIADMPVATQARILRVLTDQSFTRVGGTRVVKVDVRVVLRHGARSDDRDQRGRFREDLYYRLNVVPVSIPPLTERREDIPVLVEHFVAHYANERRVPTPEVAPDAMVALQSYEWPGNVRQLRNVVERTAILAPGDRIGRIDLDLLLLPKCSGARPTMAAGWAPARSWALRSRKRARASSANICASRSAASPATSRAPPVSSAWNARRCTGS